MLILPKQIGNKHTTVDDDYFEFLDITVDDRKAIQCGKALLLDCKIQSLLCDKASGNSKGSKIHCAKNFSGSSKDCKIQSLLCDKVSGNSKASKVHCAKNFSGSSKDCKIQSLLCDKVSGNSKMCCSPCLGFCFASRVLLLKCLCQPMQELCAILVAPCIYKYSFFGKCSGSNISEKKSHAQHVASYIYYIYTSYLTRHLCVCHVWVERCSLLQLFFTETR